MLFLVYVGHGVEINGKTHAVMSNGTHYYNLTDYVHACAYKNCLVYTVFDCCREIINPSSLPIKVESSLQDFEGNLHILYTKRSGALFEIDFNRSHSAFAVNFT